MDTQFRLLRTACLVAAACVATACNTLPEDTVKHAVYTMLPGDTVPLGGAVALRYDEANDSRCPPGVECIWAGTIRYQFTLTSAASSEPFALTPEQPTFASTLVPGLRVALGQFDPPPVPPVGAPRPVYPVTIVVDRE